MKPGRHRSRGPAMPPDLPPNERRALPSKVYRLDAARQLSHAPCDRKDPGPCWQGDARTGVVRVARSFAGNPAGWSRSPAGCWCDDFAQVLDSFRGCRRRTPDLAISRRATCRLDDGCVKLRKTHRLGGSGDGERVHGWRTHAFRSRTIAARSTPRGMSRGNPSGRSGSTPASDGSPAGPEASGFRS